MASAAEKKNSCSPVNGLQRDSDAQFLSPQSISSSSLRRHKLLANGSTEVNCVKVK